MLTKLITYMKNLLSDMIHDNASIVFFITFCYHPAGTISALFLLAGLAAGSGLAYALMPLTTLDSTTYCVNSTLASACNFTNSTNVTSIFLS